MKLLIVTQAIDKDHADLSFSHRWVEAFAGTCEQVQVICLWEGRHELPENVTVHSLGKEDGKGRVHFVTKFLSLAWRLRNDYDAVFVHQNQEYPILAGWLWKLLRKPSALWRNHYAGSWLTKVAGAFSSKVFYTSAGSYTASFKNAIQMPIGIDFDCFAPAVIERKQHSILYVGRIAAPKRIELILEAFKRSYKKNNELTFTFVGGVGSGSETYTQSLQRFVDEHNLPVQFVGPIPWEQLPEVYSAHELFINLAPPGMFDKVIGEAVACGCDVITTNPDSAPLGITTIDTKNPVEPLTAAIDAFVYDKDRVAKLRGNVQAAHSLDVLVEKAIKHLQT